MLQHNLLIAIRGFRRHKTTFLINLIGLSTGLAAALLIFLWVDDERSVDTFHEKDDRLYWIMTNFAINDDIQTREYSPGKLAQALVNDFPEVEDAVRVANNYFRPKGTMSFGDHHFKASGLFASTNFFDVLSYELVLGNPKKVLSDKTSVVISEELAIKMFGDSESSIGKTVVWENRFFDTEYVISGVFKSPPKNASNQFNVVLSYQKLIEINKWADHWNGAFAETYAVLKEETDINEFNQKIANYLNTKTDTDRFTLFAQQYSKNYLYGKYEGGIQTGGRIENVRLFTFIAVFILAIACINFMNLSTAQASKKLKEVGVKKAIGANRPILILQFLSESILLAIISFFVSIGLVVLVLPQFNTISGKVIDLQLNGYLLPILLLVTFTGIFAGSYPAFYLSRFKPVAILKGRIGNLRGEEWVRKGLVVVQFSLSIIFIVGVIVINRQIEYTQSKELGYDRSDIVTFRDHGKGYPNPVPFFNELEKIPGVLNASNFIGDFLSADETQNNFSWKEGQEDDSYLFMSPMIGYDFIETIGMEIVAGRSFSREYNDNNRTIILNESAVRFMELENPIGTKISLGRGQTREIVGVVKDFHYGSLHQKIEPMIMRCRDRGKQYFVKLRPGSEVETLARIEEAFKRINSKQNLEASFLQDDYTELYDTENRVAGLSNYMTGIAIIISCLGLFGLAAFTAERRTKEIGIRKILGASRLTIMRILTRMFMRIVLVAIVLALPIGYFVVESWLQNFAYAIELQWWFFVIAGASALLVAWLTVGFQTFKAATVNPAQILRNE